MESKHTPPAPTSPTTYTESYRDFQLSLQFGPAGVRAVADGRVQWLTPWGYSWIAQLERARDLVDRYLAALENCARISERRQLGRAAGAVERPAVYPAVRG